MTKDRSVEEPCEVTSLTHGFGAERRGRPLRLGNPLMELLGKQERYQEAEEAYQQLLLALAELEDEDGEQHVLDARTHDIREYLHTKQIRREKPILPALQAMQKSAPFLLGQSQQAQHASLALLPDSDHRSLMPFLEPHALQEAHSSLPSDKASIALRPPTLSSTDELLDRFIRAMKKPSTMNETTCRYIETRTDRYWKDHYDALFAPSDLLSDALGQLQNVILLLENALLPTVHTRLCASASRIAQFVGALYFDIGNYTYSKRYRQMAILAAREAKHQELEAVAWGRLSMTPISCSSGSRFMTALWSCASTFLRQDCLSRLAMGQFIAPGIMPGWMGLPTLIVQNIFPQ